MSNTELGWKNPRVAPSLPESHATIHVPSKGGFWRTLFAFAGPGMMVAVGYMDPGNWATDLAGGSHFGFMLLSVVLISNLMAILLQHLSLKLGIATGRDLAQACRDSFSRPVSFVLWILCEVAIAACDLAEIIGSAIALNLLFGLPLIVGVCLTALDVLVILFLQNRGFRYLEAIIIGLIVLIAGCFLYEIVISQPDMKAVLGGLVPSPQVVFNPQALYIAIGILGATVMPHNLYLHSSIVQTRNYERSPEGRKRAVRFATIDSTVSLLIAFFINASILILAGTAFHGTVNADVDDIGRAYQLLAPVLGVSIAGTVFAVALLASGMNSTITGTLAGQIVMEGFLNIRLKPWLRRLITRMIAIVPAIVVTIVAGSRGANALLILSQVILSMQLSFAVIPLVLFTSDKKKMGALVNPPWIKYLAFTVTAVIVGLNAYLLGQTFFG